MSEFELKITIDESNQEAVQVRAWIDPEPSGDLSSEQEIELVPHNGTSWLGRFSTRGEAFTYRVGICAKPSAVWSLSVRDARSNGNELMFDADMLTMAKEWLVGTYDPPSSAADARPEHTSV
jgi:hypothetical protein